MGAALAILSPVKCAVPRFHVWATRWPAGGSLRQETLKGARILGRYIFLLFLCPSAVGELLAENRPQSAELC